MDQFASSFLGYLSTRNMGFSGAVYSPKGFDIQETCLSEELEKITSWPITLN